MNMASSNQGVSNIWHATIISRSIDQHNVICAAVPDRVENIISCAIVHRVAYNSPFPAAYTTIVSYIHREFFSRCALAQIRWVDIAFELTASRDHLYDVSGMQLDINNGSVAKIVKSPMDLAAHKAWVARAQNSIDLLLALNV